ncbi:retroviral-like aspartic protease family protein [Sphingosinicella sp. CPCC 101087]|uniref:retroviral-like aspartic protease family protein n=1 Tax=Sphingosinicella sp. CPCC 101087 TaxID=2497754 RepID=UPI0013EE11D8|nr:retroviral-like aspartic protease family protein [Sphingosinicella sp. CPCC 101087]
MRLKWLTAALVAQSALIPASARQAAPAVEIAAPAPTTATSIAETLDVGTDHTARMTVPVSIGESGPFGFIVDTGSERTVISRELAQRLGLDAGRAATMYSMTESSRVDTVVIPKLGIGRRTVEAIHAPALSRANLGAEGLLGIDSLKSQRVILDFVRQEMKVMPSRRREERWSGDTIVITARSRYGHLMLVDASFDGQRVWVIVDTGSQVTVGNNALRRALERRGRLGPLRPIELVSVTGNAIMAEYGIARELRLGDAGITNLPVAFAEVHPFHHLNLTDRPAIMLGMDALQLFDRVSFDFANRRVRFLMPDPSEADRHTRMAELSSGAPVSRRAAR